MILKSYLNECSHLAVSLHNFHFLTLFSLFSPLTRLFEEHPHQVVCAVDSDWLVVLVPWQHHQFVKVMYHIVQSRGIELAPSKGLHGITKRNFSKVR